MFVRDANHRYHLKGIEDIPVNIKQKAGMNGYCRCWGWILEKINLAFCCPKELGNEVYLNRISAVKYVKRHGIQIDEQAKAHEICIALLRIKNQEEIKAPPVQPQVKIPDLPKAEDFTKKELPKVQVKEGQKEKDDLPPKIEVSTPPPLVKENDSLVAPQEKAPLVPVPNKPDAVQKKDEMIPPPVNPEEPQFLKIEATDEEILAWCNQASPERLLEYLDQLVIQFSQRPILKEVLPESFKAICNSPAITDEMILQMMQKFVDVISDDYLREFFEAALKSKHFELVSKALNFLKNEQLKFLAEKISHLFAIPENLSGMLRGYENFKPMLYAIFAEDDKKHFSRLLGKIFADAVPRNELPAFLEKLNKFPLLRLEIKLFRVTNGDDANLDKAFDELPENVNIDEAASIIAFASPTQLRVGTVLGVLAKKHETPHLKRIFLRYLNYFDRDNPWHLNRYEILENLVPKISEDLKIKLLKQEFFENAEVLKALVIQLDPQPLSELLKKIDIRNALNLLPLRDWLSQTFAKFVNAVENEEDIRHIGINFFAELSIQKASFFNACIELYNDENVDQLEKFLNLTQPSKRLLDQIQLDHMPDKKKDAIVNYIRNL